MKFFVKLIPSLIFMSLINSARAESLQQAQNIIDLKVTSLTTNEEDYCEGDSAYVGFQLENDGDTIANAARLLVEIPYGLEVNESTISFTSEGGETAIENVHFDFVNRLLTADVDLDVDGKVIGQFDAKIIQKVPNKEEVLIVGLCKPQGYVENDFSGSEDFDYPINIHQFKILYPVSTNNNIQLLSYFTNPSPAPSFVLDYDVVVCEGQELTIKANDINLPTIFKVEDELSGEVFYNETSTSESLEFAMGEVAQARSFLVTATVDQVCGQTKSESVFVVPGQTPGDITVIADETVLCNNASTQIKFYSTEEGVFYNYNWASGDATVIKIGEELDTTVLEISGMVANSTLEISAISQDGCVSPWTKTVDFKAGIIGEQNWEISPDITHLCNDQSSEVTIQGLDESLSYDFINTLTGESLATASDIATVSFTIAEQSYDIAAIVMEPASTCSDEVAVMNVPHVEVNVPEYVASQDDVEGCDSATATIKLGETYPEDLVYILRNLNNGNIEGSLEPGEQPREIKTSTFQDQVALRLYAITEQGWCPHDMGFIQYNAPQPSTLDVEIEELPEIVCNGQDVTISFFGKDGVSYQLWNTETEEQIGEDLEGAEDWLNVEMGALTETLSFGIKEAGECTSWEGNEGELTPVTVDFEVITEDRESLTEGCDSMLVLVNRPADRSAYAIDFQSKGMAELGIDFGLTATEIQFEKGQETAEVVVYTMADEEKDGNELLALSIGTEVCEAPRTEVEFTLIDVAPLMVQMESQVSTSFGRDLLLKPESVSGGTGEYTYLWNGEEGRDELAMVAESDTVIVLTVIDECGTTVEHEIKIDVLLSNEEVATATNLNVYPNPAISHVSINAQGQDILSVELINTQGQVVLSEGNVQSSISLENIPAGMYMIRVRTEAGVHSSKLFVRK